MTTDPPVAFGTLLKRHRVAAGLTQEELAERSGLSVRGISDLERGRRSHPYHGTIRLLADTLGLRDADRSALIAAAHQDAGATVPVITADPPTNLPNPVSSFIGREDDLRAVCQLLERPEARLINLTGPGGVGKTRLALRIASETCHSFPDGVYFVPLASLHDPGLVITTIAHVLGLPDTTDEPPMARIIGHLRGKHLLLVLDNFEHLLTSALSVSELLAACPDLKVLVTSRALLHLNGEHEFSVAPLALPDPAQSTDLERVLRAPAAALLIERLTATAPRVCQPPGEPDAQTISEICRRTDGLPLAIELAAARARHLTLAELAVRLQRRLDLLTQGPIDLPPRQQTLRDTIAWSYDLLSAEDQRLLRWLAVFVGGWSTESAEALCATSGGESGQVLDGLAALVDGSLIYVDTHADNRTHYGMLETIREFAEDQLRASGEEKSVRRAHAEVIAAYAERADRGLRSEERKVWARAVAWEVDNVRAALRWLLDHDETERALTLVGNLLWFWDAVARGREGRAWGEAALAKANADPESWAYARALHATGQEAWVMGDFDTAARLLGQSVARFRALGDRHSLGLALDQLGSTSLSQGDIVTAQQQLAESVALLRETEDRWSYGLALFMLGDASLATDPEAARLCYEQSLAVFRALGDELGTAIALTGLGGMAMREGDYPRARKLFEEGLALRRAINHTWNTAISLTSLGELARREGDDSRAEAYLWEALSLFRHLGDKERAAWTLYNLGVVAIHRTNLDGAAAAFRESLALRAEQGNPASIAQTIAGLARVALLRGDVERAAQLLGAAQGIRAAHNLASPPPEDAAEEQNTLNQVESALGSAAASASVAMGYAMAQSEAIHFALTWRS